MLSLQTQFWLRALARSVGAQRQADLMRTGPFDEEATLAKYLHGKRRVSAQTVLSTQEREPTKFERSAQAWLFGPHGIIWALWANDAVRVHYLLSLLGIQILDREKVDIAHEQLRYKLHKRIVALEESEGSTLFVCLMCIMLHLVFAERASIDE